MVFHEEILKKSQLRLGVSIIYSIVSIVTNLSLVIYFEFITDNKFEFISQTRFSICLGKTNKYALTTNFIHKNPI